MMAQWDFAISNAWPRPWGSKWTCGIGHAGSRSVESISPLNSQVGRLISENLTNKIYDLGVDEILHKWKSSLIRARDLPKCQSIAWRGYRLIVNPSTSIFLIWIAAPRMIIVVVMMRLILVHLACRDQMKMTRRQKRKESLLDSNYHK